MDNNFKYFLKHASNDPSNAHPCLCLNIHFESRHRKKIIELVNSCRSLQTQKMVTSQKLREAYQLLTIHSLKAVHSYFKTQAKRKLATHFDLSVEVTDPEINLKP